MSTIEATRETTQYTPEDLLSLPDGGRYKLVDGHLLEKPMGVESDWIGDELRFFVKSRRCGISFGPLAGYQCFRNSPNKVVSRTPRLSPPAGSPQIAFPEDTSASYRTSLSR